MQLIWDIVKNSAPQRFDEICLIVVRVRMVQYFVAVLNPSCIDMIENIRFQFFCNKREGKSLKIRVKLEKFVRLKTLS